MAKFICPLMEEEAVHFSCANPSIDLLVRESYFVTLLKQAYGHQIRTEDQVVGYYLIHFRSIKNNKINQMLGQPEEEYESSLLDFYIALHIKYLAIDKEWQHRGIGTAVLKGLIDEGVNLSKKYPIRMITIDALAEYYNFYKKIGFQDIPGQKPAGPTIPMFLDCMSVEEAKRLKNFCNEETEVSWQDAR